MKKKMLVSLGIVSIIILSGGIAYAEELEETLKVYLTDPSLDWLGRGYDKILFNEKLGIIDDVKTMPLQAKCIYKMATQKPNMIAYSGLGGTMGFKAAVGARAFNKIVMNIIKIAVR